MSPFDVSSDERAAESASRQETVQPAVLSISADALALEEWRQLQAIIGRHEGLVYQVRGWLLVLIGALVAVLYTEKTQLTPTLFGGISGFVIVLFWVMELVVRVPKRKAINRAGDVESALRGEQEYDGPAINRALSHTLDARVHLSMILTETRIALVWTFYLAVLVVVAVIALLSNSVSNSMS